MFRLLAALCLVAAWSTAHAASFTVGVKKVGRQDDDFDAAFRHGPISFLPERCSTLGMRAAKAEPAS